MASSSAAAFGVLRTLISPRVTFSRAVLWAKRLKLWNTMPTSARRAASSLPSAASGLPSRVMVPLSMVSRRLMVRHSVDLPEPEGPMTTTTSPRWILTLMSRSTWRSPKCLSTWSRTTSGSAPREEGASEVAASETVIFRP